MDRETALEALKDARREARLRGCRVHFFGSLEAEEVDDDMRTCGDPDHGESIVIHPDAVEITGGEWCPGCGETDVDYGEA